MTDGISVTPRREAGNGPGGGTRRMQLMRPGSLGKVLDLAVSRALRRRMPSYDARAVADVQQITRHEFGRLLRANSRSVRGIPKDRFMRELEHSRDGILIARNRAQAELDELRHMARRLRNLQVADERALREESEVRAERHRQEVDRCFAEVLERAQQDELSPARLRAELVRVATRLAREEWERSFGFRLRDYGAEADRYERRIAKLSRSLERTEGALQALAKLKEGDPGIASMFRTVQGLTQDVEHADLKRAILTELFEANVVLQNGVSRQPSSPK